MDLPADAKVTGARIRWWQPDNNGRNKDDWAIDNIYIGGNEL